MTDADRLTALENLTELMWAHQENLIERMYALEKQVEALQARVQLLSRTPD